jgi:hypothetical protein
LHYLQLAAYPWLHKQAQDRGLRENRKIRARPDSQVHLEADSQVHLEADSQVQLEADSQVQLALVEQVEQEQKEQAALAKLVQEVDLARVVRKNIIPANLEDQAAVQAASQVPLVQVEAVQLLNNPRFFGC